MIPHHPRRGIFSLCLLLTMMVLSMPFAAQANDVTHTNSFQAWLQTFRTRALGAGIRAEVFENALSHTRPIDRVMELDQKQPEKTRDFAAYRDGILSPKRVAEGQALYKQHHKLLKEIEAEYGVPASVIVALWGVETHYGRLTGGFKVVDALATLAYEGRRRDYFEEELLAALRILQAGHITVAGMTGSWAGAMGQCQFMPSSFLRFAQDHDGDGHRNIWGSVPDVFASTANYLNQSGWVEGDRWGREVKLSPAFDESQIGLQITHPVHEWARRGVTLPNGRQLPTSDMLASIVRPADRGAQAYLVYPNYRAIMSWNRSTYFATTVGLLADRIALGR